MSLFGKVDQEIPILTRFYQVDKLVDSLFLEFVDVFKNRDGFSKEYDRGWIHNISMLSGSELYRFLLREQQAELARAPNSATDSLDFRVDPTTTLLLRPDQFLEYVTLHKAVRELLDAIADDLPLLDFDYDFLLEKIAASESISIPAFFRAGESGRTSNALGNPIGFDHRNNVDGGVSLSPKRVILSAIIKAPTHPFGGHKEIVNGIKELFDTEDKPARPVSRCIECHNPYIFVRSDQTFCSNRCSDRNGKRRRRKIDS